MWYLKPSYDTKDYGSWFLSSITLSAAISLKHPITKIHKNYLGKCGQIVFFFVCDKRREEKPYDFIHTVECKTKQKRNKWANYTKQKQIHRYKQNGGGWKTK